MSNVVLLVVSLLSRVIPALGGNAQIVSDIITTLIQIMPELIKEVKDIAPLVHNIITVLRATDGVTPEQLKALDDLESQIDVQFDQVAKDEGFGA